MAFEIKIWSVKKISTNFKAYCSAIKLKKNIEVLHSGSEKSKSNRRNIELIRPTDSHLATTEIIDKEELNPK
jgi:hypothetical protein